jgi:hypothetical protein
MFDSGETRKKLSVISKATLLPKIDLANFVSDRTELSCFAYNRKFFL